MRSAEIFQYFEEIGRKILPDIHLAEYLLHRNLLRFHFLSEMEKWEKIDDQA